MAGKDKAKAKRITSLLSLTNPYDSKGDVRSFSDPSGVQSPSDRSASPPTSASLIPPSSARESRSASPLRGRAPSPFSSEFRRSWRSRSRAAARNSLQTGPPFWIISRNDPELPYDEKLPYDVSELGRSEKVLELWDDEGDAYVCLFPPTSNKGPVFKVNSSVFSSSSILASIAYRDHQFLSRHSSLGNAMQDLYLDDPVPLPANPNANENESDSSRDGPETDISKEEVYLYYPFAFNKSEVADEGDSDGQPSPEVMEELVAIRNLFAFLTRRQLVASRNYPTIFSVFMKIAGFLQDLRFSNLDGSTFGEIPSSSFQFYIDIYNLGDVRHSREKTIQALVLGERMKSYELYNEAFVHGVGKYEALKKLGSPHFDEISSTTHKRMERSFMDLQRRINSARARISEFEFPSLFAGIASSTSSDESKTVHFKAWKASFNAFRKHTINYYKQQFGSWPPKTSGKKIEFEESGLNRMVLRLLYKDMSDLYDLLVDRTALTTRSEGSPRPQGRNEHSSEIEDPTEEALRKIMSEFDRSSPPVQPAIPFDVPKLPILPPSSSTPPQTTTKKSLNRKLPQADVYLVLNASYNADALKPTSFLTAYRLFEQKAVHNKTLQEMHDQRNGYWIFLYAVLQSLPLLVVDAPGLQYTEGVEYFLCQPPKGGLPWSKEDRRKSWYGIPGGSGMVSLPPDIVDHGVEGVYRRSHCWEVAEQWMDQLGLELSPPPPAAATMMMPDNDGSMPTSAVDSPSSPSSPTGLATPSGYTSKRASRISLGLEALPFPPGAMESDSEVPTNKTAEPNRNMKFEDILPDTGKDRKGAGKKRWGF